ncbi:hypothetical protein CDIK_0217 [Cucumispora dikerogammari]|nr:hypothetical protein CDIK_0217 [Cucumispora dikerogammari]
MNIRINKGKYKIKFILNVSQSIYQQSCSPKDIYNIICTEVSTNRKEVCYLVGNPLGLKTVIEIKRDLFSDLIYKKDYNVLEETQLTISDLEKAATQIRELLSNVK